MSQIFKSVTSGNLPQTSQTGVYVNPQTGSDTSGTGSAINPYATIAKAYTSIGSSATAAKPYTVILTGIATEATVVIKPFINLFGYGIEDSIIGASSGAITLDASWLSATAPTCEISGIGLATGTAFTFDFSAGGGAASAAGIVMQDCIVNSGNCSITGAGGAINMIFTVTNVTINGTTVFTDIGMTSKNNTYGGNSSYVSTSASGARTGNFNGDKFTGFFNVSETSGQTITANMNNCAIAGASTMTGATVVFNYDTMSFPKGGITIASSATALPKSPLGYIEAHQGTTQNIAANTITAVQFPFVDKNTFAGTSLVISGANNTTFTNSSGGDMFLMIYTGLMPDATSATHAGWGYIAPTRASGSGASGFANMADGNFGNEEGLSFCSPFFLANGDSFQINIITNGAIVLGTCGSIQATGKTLTTCIIISQLH